MATTKALYSRWKFPAIRRKFMSTDAPKFLTKPVYSTGAPNPQLKEHRRILIIDDKRAIHDAFRKILSDTAEDVVELDKAASSFFSEAPAQNSQNSFVLDSAYQGQEGLALVQQSLQTGNRYQMAFVDVRMPPGWDGIETTSRIWEIDPDLQIVICTAYSDYSWDQMAKRLDASDRLVILKKPFDTIEVLQLANALTEKWRLAQQVRQRVEDLERVVNQRTQELRAANEALLTDIADRKRARTALAESEASL